MALKLSILDSLFAVCRLAAQDEIPTWMSREGFSSVTHTAGELSVVCLERGVPAGVKSERGWRIIQVEGPLDFGLTGILASIAEPLARAKISIFAISTFDTDYILVRDAQLANAKQALVQAGFRF